MNNTADKTNQEIHKIFNDFNYAWEDLFTKKPKNKISNEKKSNIHPDEDSGDAPFFEIKGDNNDLRKEPLVYHMEIRDDKTNKKDINKRVGIVNLILKEENLENSLKGCPNKSKARRKDLFEILNYAIKKKIEILVFPEASIPIEWLPLLVEQAGKNNMAILGGAEYYLPKLMSKPDIKLGEPEDRNGSIADNNAYNIMFSIFPVKKKRYNSAVPVLRIKNHYSPMEIQLIEGYHFDKPDLIPEYHLYHWRNIYFSVYNCFELSNISDRALFKSKVDFIAAIEFNRDTGYFSNIAESWARDLHCFILQSNASNYGDSRIVQPTKSETKDVLRIKGGDHPLVLVSDLNIEDLRDFQRKSHNMQLIKGKQLPYYKPSPARYDWNYTEERIKNNSILGEPWIRNIEELKSDTRNKKNDE